MGRTSYFFYQKHPEGEWLLAPSANRERIIHSFSPPFVTVLDVDNNFEQNLTAEEYDAIGYSGPFYADFDGGLDEVIPAFKSFLGKLVDQGITLSQCRLYATGGRGFHVEIPMACFLPKEPSEGIARLPAIYKEMAYSLYVDSLDLRVYSAKRGRMWRTLNVQRANGLYKVAITPEEALAMTPTLYAKICREPRTVPTESPTLSGRLAAIYIACRDKVLKARRPSGKTSQAVKQRFAPYGHALPPSLLALASGQIPPRDQVGWNQIAMQLAISASAMGIDENKLVSLCANLIESHQGDGRKYHTTQLREAELRKQFRYMQDNPSYEFSAGAVRALLPAGIRCRDLRGL